MKYVQYLTQLTKIKEELEELGCNPVADRVQESIQELIYAWDNNLIK